MKNIKKILPAIALVGAGAVALAGAGNASAYNYSQRPGYHNGTYAAANDPSDVSLCVTITGITAAFSTDVTFTLSTANLSSSSINLQNVVSANANTDYTSSSARAATAEISINTTETTNPTGGSFQKCAHLDFSAALARDANFDAHSVPVTGVAFSNDKIETVDPSGTNISFGYQLSLDSSGYPTDDNGTYESEYWLKSAPSYSAAISPDYGHLELTQKVKGHAADPTKEFTIKSRVYNTTRDDSSNTYSIYISGKSPVTCHFASGSSDSTHDCTFTLKHNETAYIGCDNASSTCTNDGQFIQGVTDFHIVQTEDGYTTFLDNLASSTNVIDGSLNTALVSHTYNSWKDNSISGRFLSILPFIILATIASAGVVVLRKSSKKKAA